MKDVNIEPQTDINLDYTEWQRHLFEDMTLEELNEAAATFSKENPL